jgi:hypothetical protein
MGSGGKEGEGRKGKEGRESREKREVEGEGRGRGMNGECATYFLKRGFASAQNLWVEASAETSFLVALAE